MKIIIFIITIFTIFFTGLIFNGCSVYYYSPDNTLTDCQKAYQECKYDAMKSTAAITSPSLSDKIILDVEKKTKDRELIAQCMKLKGYQAITEQKSNACKQE